MEYVILNEKTGERLAIPDAVCAASEHRELVTQYIAADEKGRESIHKLAVEKTTPKEEPKKDAAPASATPTQPQSAPAPVKGKE